MTIITTDKTLRPRDPWDHYPTQIELCRAAINLLPERWPAFRILDPGCGAGPWGTAARERWQGAFIHGVDIHTQGYPVAYSQIDEEDFLMASLDANYDLIVGNPPYRYAEEFVRKSYELLVPNGAMIFLLRLNFLASRKRATGLFSDIRPKKVYVLATRPSFTGDNKSDDNEYGLFLWTKPASKLAGTGLYWLDWKVRPEK